jgi:hypothetical protein
MSEMPDMAGGIRQFSFAHEQPPVSVGEELGRVGMQRQVDQESETAGQY